MKRIVVIAVAAALCMALQGCAFLSDEQRQMAVDAIQKLVSDGVLTVEQGAALKASIGGGAWSEILTGVGSFVGAVVTSLLGVRWWRGSTLDRNGLPPQQAALVVKGA